MHHPTDRIAHSTAFVTPVVGHWLEREIAQGVDHEGSIRRPIAPRADALTTELHLAARVKGTGEGAGIMFGSFSSPPLFNFVFSKLPVPTDLWVSPTHTYSKHRPYALELSDMKCVNYRCLIGLTVVIATHWAFYPKHFQH